MPGVVPGGALSVLIALPALAALPFGRRVVAGVPAVPGEAPHREVPGAVALGAVTVLVATAVTVALHDHPSWLPAYVYLAVVGVWLAVIDLRVHRLPDHLVLPSYPVLAGLFGLAALVTAEPDRLLRAGVAAAAVWMIFLGVHCLPRAGLGRGDVKVSGLLGGALGWLGWPSVVFGLFAGVVLGGLWASALLVAGRVGRHDRIAYGPFLLAGTLLAVLGRTG
ncbi:MULTISPECIES: prepilin peptidase [unclassified Frankia]